jgi:hypothetical protein
MKGMGGAVRIGAAMLVAAAFTACRDSGLPDRNLPLEEARTRPFRYSTYDAAGDLPAVTVGERQWLAAGAPMHIPDRLLTPLAGGSVYALATDAEPYTRLFVRSPSGFVPLAPVP